jgi:hypothetical protein
MLAVDDERERRMDLRFGLLGAALVNVLAQPKRPVTPADIMPMLAPAEGREFPTAEELAAKLAGAFGLET